MPIDGRAFYAGRRQAEVASEPRPGERVIDGYECPREQVLLGVPEGISAQVLDEGRVLVLEIGDQRAMSQPEHLDAQGHQSGGSGLLLPAELRRASVGARQVRKRRAEGRRRIERAIQDFREPF